MGLDFLSGATGDPINLKRRIAEQASRGIPADAGYTDFRSNGGPAKMESLEIARQIIQQGGEPGGALTGKLNLVGDTFQMGDVDPANPGILSMLASLFKSSKHTDNTTWQQWIFALTYNGGGSSAYSQFLTYLEDNDVLPRFRITDLLISGYGCQAGPGDNLLLSFPFVGAEFDFFDDASQESGSGSTLPKVKRFWDQAFAADGVDKDIWIKITSLVGTTVTYQTKVGAAASYSDSQTVELGSWGRLYDESGARIGTLAEQAMVYWPTGATLVALDEFKVQNRRASWSSTLGVERPISSVNTLVYLDGEEIRIEGGVDIQVAWETIERSEDTAGRQGATVKRKGNLTAQITLNRKLIDLTLQSKILNGAEVAFVFDAVTDAEITAGRPYRFLQVFPACKVSGQTFGVDQGAQGDDEEITLTARKPDSTYTYDGMDFDSAINIEVENDVTALA